MKELEVVLIGASGLVGNSLLQKLLDDTNITKVRIIVRRSIERKDHKLEEIVIPHMSPDILLNQEIRGDIFICTLGTTIKKAGSQESFINIDKELVITFSQLALSSPCRALYIISALGANPNSFIFYNKVKGEMEREVSELDLKSVYFLRPGLLIGERNEFRFGEKIGIFIYKLLDLFLPERLMVYLGTEVEALSNWVLKHMKKDSIEGRHIVTDFNSVS